MNVRITMSAIASLTAVMTAFLVLPRGGPFDPATWRQANPSGGVGFRTDEDLRRVFMVDSLTKERLRPGIYRSEVRQVLGEPNAGGEDEDQYALASNPRWYHR